MSDSAAECNCEQALTLQARVLQLETTLRAVVAATEESHATGARFAHDLAKQALKSIDDHQTNLGEHV